MDDDKPAERRLQKIVDADKAARDSVPFRDARRNVIHQLGAEKPDIDVVKRDITVVLDAKGYDGCFEPDALLQLSIGDALTANKGREVAKPAVECVTQALLKVTQRESQQHRSRVNIANALFSDPDKRGGRV